MHVRLTWRAIKMPMPVLCQKKGFSCGMCTRMDIGLMPFTWFYCSKNWESRSVQNSWVTAEQMQNGVDRQYCSVTAHNRWQSLWWESSIMIAFFGCNASLSKQFPPSLSLKWHDVRAWQAYTHKGTPPHTLHTHHTHIIHTLHTHYTHSTHTLHTHHIHTLHTHYSHYKLHTHIHPHTSHTHYTLHKHTHTTLI